MVVRVMKGRHVEAWDQPNEDLIGMAAPASDVHSAFLQAQEITGVTRGLNRFNWVKQSVR